MQWIWDGRNLLSERAQVLFNNEPVSDLRAVVQVNGPEPAPLRAQAAASDSLAKDVQTGTSLDLGWAYLDTSTPEKAIHKTKTLAESIQREQTGDTCGPLFERLGPGEAYVDWLRSTDQLADHGALRPSPSPSGPFVLLRNRLVVSNHLRLADAFAAAQDGDVIEIRGDGPFPGCRLESSDAKRRIKLRAAPGYLPVIRGAVAIGPQSNAGREITLDVEGIRFEQGGLSGARYGLGKDYELPWLFSEHPLNINHFARVGSLQNCSFAGSAAWLAFVSVGDAPPRLENCVLSCGAAVTLLSGSQLNIDNCIAGGSLSLPARVSTCNAR